MLQSTSFSGFPPPLPSPPRLVHPDSVRLRVVHVSVYMQTCLPRDPLFIILQSVSE